MINKIITKSISTYLLMTSEKQLRKIPLTSTKISGIFKGNVTLTQTEIKFLSFVYLALPHCVYYIPKKNL